MPKYFQVLVSLGEVQMNRAIVVLIEIKPGSKSWLSIYDSVLEIKLAHG